MSEFEACEKVSSEFPAGPCGPVCDPSRYSFCGCASCAQRVWGTNALQIVFTGIGAPPNPYLSVMETVTTTRNARVTWSASKDLPKKQYPVVQEMLRMVTTFVLYVQLRTLCG
jgi:hypothetical protein